MYIVPCCSGGPVHLWYPLQHSATHRCVHHLSGLPDAAVTGGLGSVFDWARHQTQKAGTTCWAGWDWNQLRTQLDPTGQDLHVHISPLTRVYLSPFKVQWLDDAGKSIHSIIFLSQQGSIGHNLPWCNRSFPKANNFLQFSQL